MNPLDALLAFSVACLASLALVPLAARTATRLGAVDAPDDRRKNQERAVPLFGGLAVALSTGIAIVAALVFQEPASPKLPWSGGAIPSVLVLLAVGILDDTIGLTGIYKLVGQTMSASLLIAGGFRFVELSLFGWSIPLGDFDIPFSLFFCLGAMNAFNLIDGADALAASIGSVVCFTLGVVAGFQGALVESICSFAMAGSLVGFLRYNAPPAKIYLGDTGSMFIGWFVAAAAISCSIKEQAAIALTVPVAICAIPILDAGAALIRRLTTGQSVFTADRSHLHHALLLRGWSVGQTAALAAGLTAITCAGAVTSYFTKQDAYALMAAGGVVATLAAARIFGHSELALLASHAQSFAKGAWRHVRPRREDGGGHTDHAIQLQGRRQWRVIWNALCEAAPVHRLGSLKLNVNIPHLHESFYASWKAADVTPTGDAWRMALPLNYGGGPIGRLLIVGGDGGATLAEMQQVLDFLEPLESEISRLIDEVEANFSVTSSPGQLLRGVAVPDSVGEPLAAAADYH
jgi:UDP-GlcNAc:undecaprenyl-phosphate GlcNAc-1-phosphate transferase